MDFWQRYRIVQTRDSRFDGQFFSAVRTTGIYCRPSCPARTPKAENLTFYATSAAAHDAGYRACKRCLPEATPGSPAWNLRSDAAARAMRLIGDGLVDRAGVSGLATALGYSSRQLNRILLHELGAGPLALARASRAQTARTLLTATDLKLADVAFAAGFSSVRAFNETIAEVFALTPTALRATARRAPRHASATPATLTLVLPFRTPFDPGIFTFLTARAVAGVESGSRTSYARALVLPFGDARFEVQWDGTKLVLSIATVDIRNLPALLSRVRRLFDLDADPAGIDAALSSDPAMAARVAAAPGIRLPGALDPQEMLLRAMVGQQISVSAATTALGRLAAAGSASTIAAGTLTRHFPTAAEVADQGGFLLRGPARRIDAIRSTAAKMADGSLTFGLADDTASLAAKLLPLPGIGPWTVGYLSMRVLGAPDILLAEDAAVRNGLRALTNSSAFHPGGKRAPAPSPAAIADFTAPFRPWRSYATLHLWRAAARTVPADNQQKAAS